MTAWRRTRCARPPYARPPYANLEALHIGVIQGQAAQALPEIDARLAEVRGWWQRHHAGETVPEAPDPEALGRALVSGLDIAYHANLALERWQDCLDQQLAALVYRIVAGHHEHLKFSLHNLAIYMRRAAQAGQRYDLPPLAELLALPEFDTLRQFLEQRGVAVADLQAVIDQVVEAVRRQE